MSKELDSIIEDFANKLSKALKDSSTGDAGKKSEGTETKKEDTTSKISVGGTKDPAKRAKEMASMTEELRLQYELNAAYMDFAEIQDSLIDLRDQEARIMEEKEKIAAQIAINDTEANRSAQARLDAELAKIQKILDPQREKIKNLDKMSTANKQLKASSDAYFDSLVSKIGLSTNIQKGFVGQFMSFANKLKAEGGAGTFFKSLGTAIVNLPLSIIDTMIERTIGMIGKLDAASASFAGATGFGQKYKKEIIGVSLENIRLGISGEDASKAMQSMIKTLGNTSLMSSETRKSLAATAAQLNKLGVAFDDTAKSVQFFNKISGMTVSESEKVTKRMFQMGTAIDITVEQMSKDFVAAIPKLAVYGRKSEEIFMKLAAASKAAGVNMQAMLNMAGQFDTFSGAAEAAGKLNAILGTQISATEMVRMTEEQRVETIIQQIQLSGRSFSDLDRYTQKAVAASVGITDMAEANLIFNMSMSEYASHQAEMKSSEADQKKLNDAIKAAQPLMEKLQIALSKMFVANEDFIMSIVRGTEALVNFIDEHAETIKMVALLYGAARIAIPIFRTLGLVVRGFSFFTGLASKALGLNTIAHKGNNIAKQTSIPLNRQVGSSGMFAAKGIFAIGVALGAAFAGAGVLVAGVAALAMALKDMSSEEISNLQFTLIGIAAGMFIFSAGIIAIGAAATGPQALGIAAVAAAVFAVGSAIGMATAGIGVMAMGLSMMAENGAGAAGSLFLVGIAMYAFVLGMSFIGPIATGVIGLTLALGAAFLLVALGAKMLGDSLEPIVVAMNKAGPGTKTFASAMFDLGLAMFVFAAAMYALGTPPASIGAYIVLGMMAAAAASAAAMAAMMNAQAESVKNLKRPPYN